MKIFNRSKQKLLNENVQALAEDPTPAERKIVNERAKEHFKRKQEFEKDRVGFYKTLSKVGFIIGGVGALIGLAGVVAVAGLTPLKRSEPYVIRVDNNTGFTDIVKPDF